MKKKERLKEQEEKMSVVYYSRFENTWVIEEQNGSLYHQLEEIDDTLEYCGVTEYIKNPRKTQKYQVTTKQLVMGEKYLLLNNQIQVLV